MVARPWTQQEALFAQNLHASGASPEAIAIAMPHRTPNAIEAKLNRAGVLRIRVRQDTLKLDLCRRLRGRGALRT